MRQKKTESKKSNFGRSFPLVVCRDYTAGNPHPYPEFYQQGIRLFQVRATCSEDFYHPELRVWTAPDRFDYSYQERYWKELLERCPEAKLSLMVYVGSPPWWDEAHPGELQQYADGRTVHEPFLATDRRTVPSLASEVWLRDALSCLERFLAWLESSGWAERIWGILLSYGITWEWGILGSDDFADYSAPMQRRFRQWLRDFYKNDAALRKAWGDPRASFENASIPAPAARLRSDGDFRVFPRDRAAYDFQRCLSDVNLDCLFMLARKFRVIAGERYLLGTYYGYTLTAREHSELMGKFGSGGFQGGHHGLARFLDSGLFDFISSPWAYGNRSLEDGLLIQHYPLRSAQAHGLQGMDDNDLLTFCQVPKPLHLSVGHTKTLEDSIFHQRLALSQALCRKTGYWYSELGGWFSQTSRGNFSDPALLAEIGCLNKIFETYSGTLPGNQGPGKSAAQIALIVDEAAVDALGLKSKLFLSEVYDRLPAWGWCGAAFDVWLATDVTAARMKPYRLVYLFAPYLDDELRKKLRRALGRDGRTVWWAPYSGWLTDKGGDNSAFARLTGIADPKPLSGMPREKKYPGWTSLYGPVEGLSSREIAEIARRAGVHLYGEPPLQVVASERYVTVHVNKGGDYKLELPGKGPWQEVFSGKKFTGVWKFRDKDVALFIRHGA